MRIAIVDDEKDIVRYLAAALPEKGLLVEAFSNGAALKTAIPRDTFDAVVVDCNLPGEPRVDGEIAFWTDQVIPPIHMVRGSEAWNGRSDAIGSETTLGQNCLYCDHEVRPQSRDRYVGVISG